MKKGRKRKQAKGIMLFGNGGKDAEAEVKKPIEDISFTEIEKPDIESDEEFYRNCTVLREIKFD